MFNFVGLFSEVMEGILKIRFYIRRNVRLDRISGGQGEEASWYKWYSVFSFRTGLGRAN